MENMPAASSPRHAVRRARLFLCRADRRPQHRFTCSGAKNVRDAKNRTVPGSRRDAEGRATSRPRKPHDKGPRVVKFDVKTGAQRSRRPRRRKYYQVFAESLIKEAKKGDKNRRHHRRHASGTGSTCSPGIPQSLLRRRHREQHGVTFARTATEGLKPFATSTRPSCSAPMTKVVQRRRDPAAARALRMDRRRAGPAATPNPCRRLRRGHISAAFPASSSWRRPTKPSWCTWWRTSRDRRSPVGAALPARRSSGVPMRRRACRSRSARAAFVREGTKVALSPSARGSPLASRRQTSSGATACRPPSRRAFRQARSTSDCCSAWRATRGG